MNRIGAGLAVLAATVLIGAPSVAYAADPLPDLAISFDQSPVASVNNNGRTIGVHVANNGTAPASSVILTVDLSKLSDQVVATVPGGDGRCDLSDSGVTCSVGQLEAGQTRDVFPVTLASRAGATAGPAGDVTVTVAGRTDDADPANDTAAFPVTVLASAAELVVTADDLNTAKTPAGPGDKLPFHGAVFNEGDIAATGGTITLNLSAYASIAERYTDCTYEDAFPKDSGGEYVYGPSRVTCELPALPPNRGWLFYNAETGESAFNVIFGRNLPGPDEFAGSFSAEPGAGAAARSAKLAAGDGPTFAEALMKLQPPAALAKQAAAPSVPAKSDSDAPFRFWTKKNTLDVQVKATPVTGKAGQTVDLKYEVVNQGPSDGGGPSIVVTAPSGTVLLPAKGCWTDGTDHVQKAESKKLRCAAASAFPAVASGFGKIALTVKLKITSTPGTNGTIYAESCCVGSTDSNKANNTAKIVFSTGGGTTTDTDTDADTDTSGEGGGGLPITGSPVALIAAAGGLVIVLGVVLMLVFRRKRVAE